jgi:hypothetical protein
MVSVIVWMNRGMADNVNALELALETYAPDELRIYWDTRVRYKGLLLTDLVETAIQQVYTLDRSKRVIRALGGVVKRKVKQKVKPILFPDYFKVKTTEPIPAPLIGIHCRHYEPERKSPEHIASLKALIDKHSAIPGGVFVATDSQQIHEYAVGRKLMVNDKVWDKGVASMDDGDGFLKDFSCLSACSTIYATHGGLPYLVAAQADHTIKVIDALSLLPSRI